jgi:hypothetical protein
MTWDEMRCRLGRGSFLRYLRTMNHHVEKQSTQSRERQRERERGMYVDNSFDLSSAWKNNLRPLSIHLVPHTHIPTASYPIPSYPIHLSYADIHACDTARLSSSTGRRASSQTPCKPSQRNPFLTRPPMAATKGAWRHVRRENKGLKHERNEEQIVARPDYIMYTFRNAKDKEKRKKENKWPEMSRVS